MYFIKKDIDGYVRDVINVQRKDYEMLYYPYALPTDIYEGYYKIEGNRFVLDEEKKAEIEKHKKGEIAELRNEVNRLKGAILELTEIIFQEE